MGGGKTIKYVVTLMLENRSFDHMLGFLKQLNPDIDGLTGDETCPENPSDPSSPQIKVSNTAPYVTNPDPDHGINATTTQIWGDGQPHVNPPPMNGFVQQYKEHGATNNGDAIMECFSHQNVPAISALAMQYTIMDKYHASVPGPTQPNRMYIHSATSHGATYDNKPKIAEGYPQRSIYENLAAAGHEFRIYYSDFPATLIMRNLRKREYWSSIQQMNQFYADCKNGTLPAYSFLEPRWFHYLFWKASDQHPPHDVKLGEYLIADIYEALRSSPLWEETLFIITYDEHGGFYDHSPTPLDGVPNPDGIIGKNNNPPFNFDREGVRVPCVLISPWLQKGKVISEPTSNEKPQETSQFEHASVCATLKELFDLPSFLTNRDAWAATFTDHLNELSIPRSDCATTIPRPGTLAEQIKWKKAEKLEENEENVKLGEMLAEQSTAPISDLQREIIYIASGLSPTTDDEIQSILTEHDGALFVRKKLKEFFAQE